MYLFVASKNYLCSTFSCFIKSKCGKCGTFLIICSLILYTTLKNKKIDFYPNFSTSFLFVFNEIKIIDFCPDLHVFTVKTNLLCEGGGQDRTFF